MSLEFGFTGNGSVRITVFTFMWPAGTSEYCSFSPPVRVTDVHCLSLSVSKRNYVAVALDLGLEAASHWQ